MSAVTAPRRVPARPASAPRRARRHLRVVEERPRRHPVLFLLLYLATGILVVLAAVSLNALAAGDAVRARELDNRVQLAERQYELLVAEVARLENPERIRAAAEELGMVPAADPRYLSPGRGLPADGMEAEATDPVKPLISADHG